MIARLLLMALFRNNQQVKLEYCGNSSPKMAVCEERRRDLIFKHLVESLDMVELLVINLYEAGNVRACSVI